MAKLSQEVYDKIITLYQKGNITQADIAKKCNCSVDTVRRTLQRAGILESKLSKKLQNIYENVVQDFNNGLYCKDIANKYKVDEHSIYKILDKAGIRRKTGYHSNCQEDYFEKIDNPHKAYLLGFITADGAVVNDILTIEVHKDDIDLLEFAKSQINPNASLTPNRNCYKVSFGAKAIGRNLAKYGIVQNKSKIIKSVPTDLIPPELLQYYFRGLIDGDGCIHKNGRLSIYSGSKDFIEDVQHILVEKLGLTKLQIYQGTTYFISWSSKKDKQLLFDFLYKNLDATFYYKRKYLRLKENINHADTEVTG